MPRAASLGLVLLVATIFPAPSFAGRRGPPVVGRWNLTVTAPDGSTFPSWVEISHDKGRLSGRICNATGRTRELERVVWRKNQVTFVDSQVKDGETYQRVYTAKIRFGILDGTASSDKASSWSFLGTRAPKFKERRHVPWGKAVPLISKGLIGWRLRANKHGACWKEKGGVLANQKPCADLISDGRYQDFKLHLDYKVAEGASSAVYLRGRYRVELRARSAGEPTDESAGAIYGLLAPSEDAAKAPDEWQTCEVTMVGRQVTVVLNGQKVVDRQEIAGPTGGALDSEEAVPGPIMLRGDGGEVAFRNIVITPSVW